MSKIKTKIIAIFAVVALAVGMVALPTSAAQASILDGNNSDLGDLFVLDQLFGNGDGVFNGNGNNLGDLFILNELFGDGDGGIFNGDGNDLGDLFVLDQLFGDSNGIFNGNGNRNLGDLVILNELFGDGDGLMGGGGNDLGDLFILDELFNQNGGVFSSSGQEVSVQSGDTLSAIALETLGDANRYPEIAQANNIADANLIYPGQVLTIPSNGTDAKNLGDLIILDKLFN